MKVSFYLFFLSFVYSLNCYGQLSIIPTWNKKPLELQHVYLTQNKDSISFSTLKIYFSDFRFKDKISGRITSIDTLIFYDLSDSSTHSFFNDLNLSNYESVAFTLGLDSSKNVSGELENAYDPLLGMYWAWNTGYINLKIMGESSAVPTNSHEFEFHLGGYRFPFATAQTIQVDLNDQYIYFDLEKLFSENINLTKNHHIMLPCKDAFLISQGLSTCFK
ncbi:MAG: hypothetical protein EBR35_06065 [Flavobacteriales bacterium]|nr:hypothetical protein [Flavobacteriales bacterium]